MIWRVVRYTLVGAVAFAVGLVAFLPARIAAGWVEDMTTLSLGGVSGTLVSGHAGYIAGPGGAVDDIDWTLHPSALLLGRIDADLRADSDLSGFSARASRSLIFSTTTIDALDGRATVGWLAQLGGYTFLPVGADMTVDIDHVRVDDDLRVTALDGTITADNVRWELFNPAIAIGAFTGALSHADDRVKLAITDSHGPMALTGDATLGDDRRYQLDVRLRARAGADKRLKQMLAQIGRPNSQGWYRVRESGNL